MQRFYLTIGMLASLALFLAGCGGVSSMLSEPPLTENYALSGTSDVPNLTDGSMYTTEKAKIPEYVRGGDQEESRFSEVTVTLKEPKDIRKIAIRRRPDDVVAVDVDIEAMVNGEWNNIKEIRGSIDSDMDARVKVVTDQIKVKIQRATRTADGKSAIATGPGASSGRRRGAEVDRILYDPVKLAEIELYGFKEEPAK